LGITGHTAQMGLPFLNDDLLPWKPTVVILNWGMNDGRRPGGVEYYQTGLKPYLDRLLQNNLRVVLCSNSPIDIGDKPGVFTDFNRNFDVMARWAESLAREKGLPFVDQFHFLHTVWGQNRRREVPVSVTRATLSDENKKRDQPLPIPIENRKLGDYVHAAPPGNLTMAFIILKTLHAPPEVSSATLNVATGAAVTRRCTVRNFKVVERRRMDYPGGAVENAIVAVAFERQDEASPCWIDDSGAAGMELVPFQQEMNRMPLRVVGLFPGTYQLKIDGFVHGHYTDQQLADGVNLSENRASPIYSPGRNVERLVRVQQQESYKLREATFAKAGEPDNWSPGNVNEVRKQAFLRQLPELEKRDIEIAQAARPPSHAYEIALVPFEK
jgi:lysophospholipase L1-like esterase